MIPKVVAGIIALWTFAGSLFAAPHTFSRTPVPHIQPQSPRTSVSSINSQPHIFNSSAAAMKIMTPATPAGKTMVITQPTAVLRPADPAKPGVTPQPVIAAPPAVVTRPAGSVAPQPTVVAPPTLRPLK